MERDPVLDAVGPRLRELRRRRGGTLAGLSESTGISVSTLSRLESGGRKPTLELLRLGEHDFVMKAGEVAEFDTRTPHWFGSAGPEPAEVLTLFGPQGERIHVRARPRSQRPRPA
jgi:transcriptional regulator with XRE-family HTH domain